MAINLINLDHLLGPTRRRREVLERKTVHREANRLSRAEQPRARIHGGAKSAMSTMTWTSPASLKVIRSHPQSSTPVPLTQ